jgi:GntR family histidine utilization transcriptional repressor
VPPAGYQAVKAALLEGLAAGRWREGERIPSEPALARVHGVARMTVNRAVRELAAEGLLTRARGSGTFVAPPRPESTLVELRSVAEEIRARGRAHSADVLALEAVRAGDEDPWPELGLPRGARLFRSVLRHRQDGQPIQIEVRWVVPSVAPRYLEQDFGALTPSEYLVRVAPVSLVEYRIEAVQPPPWVGAALGMVPGEAGLLLHRRTSSDGQPASAADLWHPGSYRLTGHF